MKNDGVNIFLTGAGNHPVMLAGNLISKAAFYEGYDAKNTSVIALGVIGGAVVSQVRFGEKILSPLFCNGEGDYMIAFDKLEALRNCNQLKKNGTVIVANEIVPVTSVSGLIENPITIEEISEKLKASGRTILDIPIEDSKTSGIDGQMSLIGILSNRISISIDSWKKAFEDIFPENILEIKRKGFEHGRQLFIS